MLAIFFKKFEEIRRANFNNNSSLFILHFSLSNKKGVNLLSDLIRTWAEINLDNLAYNYKTIRKIAGENVKFLGVVKADAYGHGAVHIARALARLGADYLAVSSLDEARELRSAGLTLPLLILGHTPHTQVETLIKYNITQTVTCEAKAHEYEAEAAKLGAKLKIHIKLDTGMSRLGFLCAGDHFDDCISALLRCCRLPHLEAEGIFTHFAAADSAQPEDVQYTRGQLELFMRVVSALEEKGLRFDIRHCANSGAFANHPEAHLDMVRPGILTYGCGEYAKKLGLRPVMSEKTVIGTIKVFDENTPISYGGIYKTTAKTRVGVLPIGYADGLSRRLSDGYEVLTPYGKSKILGRICMDMCMIDLSEYPQAEVGDEVEIFGENMPIEAAAEYADTIVYEITCAVSKRVPRVYISGGEVVYRELALKTEA